MSGDESDSVTNSTGYYCVLIHSRPFIPFTPLPTLPANSTKARQHPPFQIRGISQHPSILTHIKAYLTTYRLSPIYTHACPFSCSLSCRSSRLNTLWLISIETLPKASKSNSNTLHSFLQEVHSLHQIAFFYLY